MAVVTVQASKSYDVLISSGLIEEAGKLVRGVCSGGKALIVSDENVFSLYGKALSRSLEMAGFHVFSFVFPSGEASKTLSTYACILDRLCEVNASRQDVTVALGGGVAGDVAGFAAATYRRGMGFVQVPTSISRTDKRFLSIPALIIPWACPRRTAPRCPDRNGCRSRCRCCRSPRRPGWRGTPAPRLSPRPGRPAGSRNDS